MGRFYKTSKARMVDYAYQLPMDMMMGAIKQQDANIDATEQGLLKIRDQLKADVLTADDAKKKQIIAGYESQVDDMVAKIAENPLAYQDMKGNLRKLGRSVHENWTRGEIYKMKANKASRDAWSAQLDDLEKKDPEAFRGKDKQALMSYYDKQYAKQGGLSYDDAKAAGKAYQTEALTGYIDLATYIDEKGNGWESDVAASKGWDIQYKNGNPYKVTKSGTLETVTPDELRLAFTEMMQADDNVMGMLQQRIKTNVFDVDEANKMFNAAINFGVRKYALKKDTTKLTATEDGFEKQQRVFAEDERVRNLEKKLAITEYVDELVVETEDFNGVGGIIEAGAKASNNELLSLVTSIGQSTGQTNSNSYALTSIMNNSNYNALVTATKEGDYEAARAAFKAFKEDPPAGYIVDGGFYTNFEAKINQAEKAAQNKLYHDEVNTAVNKKFQKEFKDRAMYSYTNDQGKVVLGSTTDGYEFDRYDGKGGIVLKNEFNQERVAIIPKDDLVKMNAEKKKRYSPEYVTTTGMTTGAIFTDSNFLERMGMDNPSGQALSADLNTRITKFDKQMFPENNGQISFTKLGGKIKTYDDNGREIGNVNSLMVQAAIKNVKNITSQVVTTKGQSSLEDALKDIDVENKTPDEVKAEIGKVYTTFKVEQSGKLLNVTSAGATTIATHKKNGKRFMRKTIKIGKQNVNINFELGTAPGAISFDGREQIETSLEVFDLDREITHIEQQRKANGNERSHVNLTTIKLNEINYKVKYDGETFKVTNPNTGRTSIVKKDVVIKAFGESKKESIRNAGSTLITPVAARKPATTKFLDAVK